MLQRPGRAEAVGFEKTETRTGRSADRAGLLSGGRRDAGLGSAVRADSRRPGRVASAVRLAARPPPSELQACCVLLDFPCVSMIERLKRMWRIQDRSLDTEHRRIDQMTASREGTAITQSEGAAIPRTICRPASTKAARRSKLFRRNGVASARGRRSMSFSLSPRDRGGF